MKTQAAVLVETNRPLEFWDLSIPDLRPGQVLVEIAYSGICHSQLLEVDGKRGEDRFLPHTLGHEGSGVVMAVGEGVEKVRVGEKVILSWIKGKGCDVPSTTYERDGRKVNSGAISTFMKHAVISENRVVPLRSEMSFCHASLLGCAIPTGAGVIFNTAHVVPQSRVAVFGVGGVGLCAVMAARFIECSQIIAVDVLPLKLETARKLGATHSLNASEGPVWEAIREISGGQGVDVAIECAGHRDAMENAFKSVKYGGGLCVLAGNLSHGSHISIDPMDLIRGKKIVGTWGGESDVDRDIPKYVAAYESGRFPMDQLISGIYRFEQINKAVDDLRTGRVIRPIIQMS